MFIRSISQFFFKLVINAVCIQKEVMNESFT